MGHGAELRGSPCRFPAVPTALHRKDRKKMPSAAVYVVVTTFVRGFDSHTLAPIQKT